MFEKNAKNVLTFEKVFDIIQLYRTVVRISVTVPNGRRRE